MCSIVPQHVQAAVKKHSALEEACFRMVRLVTACPDNPMTYHAVHAAKPS